MCKYKILFDKGFSTAVANKNWRCGKLAYLVFIETWESKKELLIAYVIPEKDRLKCGQVSFIFDQM